MKPRAMALAVFTALVGMMIAPSRLNPLFGFVGILAIATGAGAAGVLNMWYGPPTWLPMFTNRSVRWHREACR